MSADTKSRFTEHFNGPDTNLFFTRKNPLDPRLGDIVKASKVYHPNAWHIAGYPDDEGILISEGRPGASEGPQAVRRFLYKMTPPVNSSRAVPELLDIGNLKIDGALSDRHTSVRNCVREALSSGGRWLGLGGGHDYGYADGAGFLDWAGMQSARPVVINIDAHLDVRPSEKGLSSGTPFYRLLTEFPDKFDFAEIGIQNQCNSREHLRWAREQGARVILWDDIALSGESPVVVVTRVLSDWLERKRPVFLSIDLDGFAAPYGVGTSQNFPFGFTPNEFLPLLETFRARWDLRVMSFYETSPRLDPHGLTAGLAAGLAHRVITN